MTGIFPFPLVFRIADTRNSKPCLPALVSGRPFSKHRRYFLRSSSRLNYLGTYRVPKRQHNPGIRFGTVDAGIYLWDLARSEV
jgi:hypothetical protein